MDTEVECENCGMIDVPLIKDDCCAGCVCQRCHKSAFEVGGSMNDMGWCEDCEDSLRDWSHSPHHNTPHATKKYPTQCPCGIAATDCTYHH